MEAEVEEKLMAKYAEDVSILNPTFLPKILRYIGATTLGLSALSFAIQRVGELDSLGRFYSFLAFTGALAACGFLCGLKLKEDKGARTFLGISLVFLPALFLQLGGLLYFLVRGVPIGIPKIFVLTAPDSLSVFTALGISIPVALVIAFGGFSALVRSKATVLTALFAGSVGALLLPTRVVDEVSLIVLVAGLVISFFTSKTLRDEHAFKTFEGKSALAIIVLPLLLMMLRTLSLYGATALFVAAGSVVVGTFFWNLRGKLESGYASASQLLGILFYSVGWIAFSMALLTDSGGLIFISYLAGYSRVLLIPLICLPMAAGIAGVSEQLGLSQKRAVRIAGVIASYPLALHVFGNQSVGLTTLGLLVSVGLISSAFLRRDRSLLTSGIVLLGTVVVMNIHYALDLYRYNPWLMLGITGGAIVLGSSYIERNMSKLLNKVEDAKGGFSTWK